MAIFNKNSLSIYFGNAQDALSPAVYLSSPENPLTRVTSFSHVIQTMNLNSLYFLKQVHGVEGIKIDASNRTFRSFPAHGDFLITNIRYVGIGVMTADCLPIIIYDPIKQAIGIAHAGWRGSVQHISSVMLNAMWDAYGTNTKDVQAFFGPSAKSCCYVVAPDFIHNFKSFAYVDSLFEHRNNDLYFDLPGFNYTQLTQLGVAESAINRQHSVCTMCNVGYCSYRLQKENACRQMTVVSLV